MRPLPRLRQHTSRLISYCREGLTWAEMQHRLEGLGVEVALSTIQRHCTRNGFARLHPGSKHYSATILRLWEAGEIPIAALKSNTTKP